jgi:biofilm PGA synthesis N-glycosyltransferase PgaC
LIAEALFWVSAFLILYTYLIYPGIVFLLVMLKPRQTFDATMSDLPSVSVVISIYNEENILSEKLKNLGATTYPRDKIEFVVGSDGSNDRTNEILMKAASQNVHSYIFLNRRGKSAVLNELVSNAKGEIVVFSDANTFYLPNTIQRLVERFSDKSIGAVCGELVLESDRRTAGGIGEFSYWAYETYLKRLESNFRTVLGATGGVYAIRRALYKPLPTSKAVTDDFLIPLEILRKGYCVKYEPAAIAFERSADSIKGEFRRKVRIGASNFNAIPEFVDLLHPRNGFVAFALWSHKIFRWFAPFQLIVIFGASVVLAMDSSFYASAFLLQICFMILALLGFVSERTNMHIGILNFPYYFMSMNLALFVGFIKSVMGKQKSTWDIVR